MNKIIQFLIKLFKKQKNEPKGIIPAISADELWFEFRPGIYLRKVDYDLAQYYTNLERRCLEYRNSLKLQS